MPGSSHRNHHGRPQRKSALESNEMESMPPTDTQSVENGAVEVNDELSDELVEVSVPTRTEAPAATPADDNRPRTTAPPNVNALPTPPPHRQELLDQRSLERDVEWYNSPEFQGHLNRICQRYPDLSNYLNLLNLIHQQRVEGLESAKNVLQQDIWRYKDAWRSQSEHTVQNRQQNGFECGHGHRETPHDYEKDRQAHELAQLKTKLNELQTHALKSVDTFQPMPDSEIQACLEGVGLKVEGVVKTILNMKSTLSGANWGNALIPLMWENSVNAKGPPFEYEDKRIRRKSLRNLVWCFVNDRMVRMSLKAFDGVVSVSVDKLYTELYSNPRKYFPAVVCAEEKALTKQQDHDKESAKWKSMTATRLNQVTTEDADKAFISEMQTALCVRLEALGYDQEAAELQKKLRDLMSSALKLGRVLAQQRAIFELFMPTSKDEDDFKKLEDDSLMTSVERDGDNEEAGTIWFVSKPGFTKWGNGVGDDLDKPEIMKKALVELMM